MNNETEQMSDETYASLFKRMDDLGAIRREDEEYYNTESSFWDCAKNVIQEPLLTDCMKALDVE
jgi:hypothetical protein